MVTARSFTDDLLASLRRSDEDRRILAELYNVPLRHVVKTCSTTDRAGVDYLVTLPTGLRGVDVKYRAAGASRYWRSENIEEFAIETRGPLVTGTATADDYVAIFEDTQRAFLLEVAALKLAVSEHLLRWVSRYGMYTSRTRNEAGTATGTRVVYVPLPILQSAIQTVTHSGS
jgi:hypothetical protein